MRARPASFFILVAFVVFGPRIPTTVSQAQQPSRGAAPTRHHGRPRRTFRVWVFSDAHVGSDEKYGRESLAAALRESESPSGFAWDIALDLGDMSGAEGTPKDPEGEEIVRQFAVLKQHNREDIYDLGGNHDRNGLDEPQEWWWRKWLDPTGEHTEFSHVDAAKRP